MVKHIVHESLHSLQSPHIVSSADSPVNPSVSCCVLSTQKRVPCKQSVEREICFVGIFPFFSFC